MTPTPPTPLQRRSSPSPWLVSGGALLVYLLTLNHWISLQNIGLLARLSGWLWGPAVSQPLTLTVLYPFSLLPAAWVPVSLNVFTALCAATVLALLARSVALLPHDLGPAQQFEKTGARSTLTIPGAWIPPVLAAILCGLQLTFWEHATAATGEMIDLLVFAYVIRCLLEFRMDQRETWLYRSALVYGVGMANNWAMIGYFPLFLAAVFRAKDFAPFFNRRFLLRMSLFGMAGLSVYLLLPTVHALAPGSEVGFWATLKAHLKLQKSALGFVRNPAFRALAVAELLPVLLLSIRWKSHSVQFGDDTRLGVFLTKFTVHFLHAFFMFVALWVSLDPRFSPRHLNFGTSMLTCYYLSALVFGYCAGYFLLLHPTSEDQPSPPSTPCRAEVGRRRVLTLLRSTFYFCPYALLLLLPLALAWRNLDQIRLTNGPTLRKFISQLYADLPAGSSVVLSDDSTKLQLLHAELGAHRNEKSPLLLDTSALPFPGYQRFAARKSNRSWPVPLPEHQSVIANRSELLNLVSAFAAKEPIVYLEPGMSYFGERFRAEQHGVVQYLAPHDSPDSARSLPEPNAVAADQQLWQQRWTNGTGLLAEPTQQQRESSKRWWALLLRPLRLLSETNSTLSFVGGADAKAMDGLGVDLQRLGRWSDAQIWFQRALEVNPENLSAHLNLDYNRSWLAGKPERLDAGSAKLQFTDLFAKYARWGQVLSSDGPVDEPTFLFNSGHTFLGNGNTVQAAQAFARCAELAPQWLAPKLWLAQCYVRLQDFDRALELTHSVQISSRSPDATALSELLYCQATALRGLGRTNEAAACLDEFARRAPNRVDVLTRAADLFAQGFQFDAELIALDALLQRQPDHPELLKKKGSAQIQLQQFEAAISTLNRALTIDPADNEARLNRARACAEAGQLAAASADYQRLLSVASESRNALFGLAGIAWRNQDTNAAVQFYEQYLANANPQSRQYAFAAERLKELRSTRK